MNTIAPKSPRFQWRATVSVVLTFCFLMLAASGVVLFLAPPGRIANWTDWGILGMTKSEWAALHIIFATLFLLGSAFHVFYNWRPLTSYFKNRVNRRFGFRPEWVVGIVACAAVFAGTRFSVAPFSSLLDLNEELKQSWDEPGRRAPIPHAELLTVAELADEAGVDLDTALQRLETAKISGASGATIVSEVAREADVAAERIYEIIRADQAERRSGKAGSGEGRRGAAGGGIGWKTVAQVAVDEGVDVSEALQRLRSRGVTAEADSTMREVADGAGELRPFEIMEIVRGH